MVQGTAETGAVEMGLNRINARYNVAVSDSLAVKIAARQQRRMHLGFLRASAIGTENTLLDIGAINDPRAARILTPGGVVSA